MSLASVDLQCSICLDTINGKVDVIAKKEMPVQNELFTDKCIEKLESGGLNPITTKCHHVFHSSCLNQWIRQHASVAACPACRAPILAGANTYIVTNQNVAEVLRRGGFFMTFPE